MTQSTAAPRSNPQLRLRADPLLTAIADYVDRTAVASKRAYSTARYCLFDALGCALEALDYPACTKLLGPVVPGTVVPNGARVPGTALQLDPVTAAFNLGCMIRWLDFNDSFAGGAGHPSDNIGGVLAVADYISRRNRAATKSPFSMRDVLTALIKSHEIHGLLALENDFGKAGLDHGWFGRVATAAVTAKLLGGGHEEILSAASNACLEVNVRTFRQAPNTGSRKSWAGGDATARGVQLALMACKGEMGYPFALSAKDWGFYDVVLKGKPLVVRRRLGAYVMENVMFKISYPAGAHAQAAIECAIRLHPRVVGRLADVDRILITSHEKAVGVMDKRGPLTNPAARDHCLQYVVAMGLLFGNLTAQDYEDRAAADPRIDPLRAQMSVQASEEYTKAFYDLERRANPAAVEVRFRDGSSSGRVEIEYPIGHPQRRADGIPLLEAKFRASIARWFVPRRQDAILELFGDQRRLEAMAVDEFVDLFIT